MFTAEWVTCRVFRVWSLSVQRSVLLVTSTKSRCSLFLTIQPLSASLGVFQRLLASHTMSKSIPLVLHGHKLSQEAKRCEERLQLDAAARLHLAARNDFRAAIRHVKGSAKSQGALGAMQERTDGFAYEVLRNQETMEALVLLERYHKKKAKQLKKLFQSEEMYSRSESETAPASSSHPSSLLKKGNAVGSKSSASTLNKGEQAKKAGRSLGSSSLGPVEKAKSYSRVISQFTELFNLENEREEIDELADFDTPTHPVRISSVQSDEFFVVQNNFKATESASRVLQRHAVSLDSKSSMATGRQEDQAEQTELIMKLRRENLELRTNLTHKNNLVEEYFKRFTTLKQALEKFKTAYGEDSSRYPAIQTSESAQTGDSSSSTRRRNDVTSSVPAAKLVSRSGQYPELVSCLTSDSLVDLGARE